MTPQPAKQKPQMAVHTSPSFSQYGRSPSLVQPAYTTDDIAAARYSEYSWWLHCVRIALTTITLALSIAVIACAAISIRQYHDSHMEPEWLLPLWPVSVDLRPTHVVLGCGIVILIFSLAYLILTFVPMVSRSSFRPPVFWANQAPSPTNSTTSSSPPPLYSSLPGPSPSSPLSLLL